MKARIDWGTREPPTFCEVRGLMVRAELHFERRWRKIHRGRRADTGALYSFVVIDGHRYDVELVEQ